MGPATGEILVILIVRVAINRAIDPDGSRVRVFFLLYLILYTVFELKASKNLESYKFLDGFLEEDCLFYHIDRIPYHIDYLSNMRPSKQIRLLSRT